LEKAPAKAVRDGELTALAEQVVEVNEAIREVQRVSRLP
jgi:hypothetical protein